MTLGGSGCLVTEDIDEIKMKVEPTSQDGQVFNAMYTTKESNVSAQPEERNQCTSVSFTYFQTILFALILIIEAI